MIEGMGSRRVFGCTKSVDCGIGMESVASLGV